SDRSTCACPLLPRTIRHIVTRGTPKFRHFRVVQNKGIRETGDWNVASNWSPGSPAGPPKATDTGTISATGPAYTVTIDTADVAQSLTESSASATVDDTGSLTLSGTFTLSAGTFILGQGGTLSGGTTKIAGGKFVCEGGTLSGMTYDGT